MCMTRENGVCIFFKICGIENNNIHDGHVINITLHIIYISCASHVINMFFTFFKMWYWEVKYLHYGQVIVVTLYVIHLSCATHVIVKFLYFPK